MGFTDEQIAARLATQREKARLEAEAEAERLERERARIELNTKLASEYPAVPVDDAVKLWSIATQLTQQLVAQFTDDAPQLRAQLEEWRSLFYDTRPVSAREQHERDSMRSMIGRQNRTARYYRSLGLGDYEDFDLGYTAVLEQMARSIQDIGQTFALEHIRPACHGPRASLEPQARVICTAPLPE